MTEDHTVRTDGVRTPLRSVGATLEDTYKFLLATADKLDQWAQEIRRGGWSTHQVEANERLANDCRRQAAILHRCV